MFSFFELPVLSTNEQSASSDSFGLISNLNKKYFPTSKQEKSNKKNLFYLEAKNIKQKITL